MTSSSPLPEAVEALPDIVERKGAVRQLSKLGILWAFMKRYPGPLTGAILSLLVAAGATLAIPEGFKRIVDDGFGAATTDSIGIYFFALLSIVVVLAIATALRFYFISWTGERVVADIRRSVHTHLLTLSPAFYEENSPSELASRLTADAAIIETTVGSTVSIALRNIVTGTGGVIYLFLQSPKLTGLMLLVIPLMIGPIVFMGRRVRMLSRLSQDRIADVAARASESLRAIRVVQAFTQERREAAQFGRIVEEAFDAAKRRIRTRSAMTALVIFLVFAAITLVLWEGAIDVIEGRLSGGTITAFIFAAAIVAGAFGALTEVFGDLMRGAGAAGRLAEVLNTRPEIAAPERPLPMPEPARGAIRFDHVAFSYPSKPGVRALHDFDLEVLPGETVAIVGPSGAGKSTLFQLIQRFYDPQRGQLLVDGVPITEVSPLALRRRLSVVPQETVVFGATARENILFGRPDATERDIEDAARAANALEFLEALPEGLDTYLGEAGVRLSGGQRQRLAIARAILRDAPILLLDEATSALDTESERLVQSALANLMRGRTTLVIAHRLSTVRDADRIVVVDGGRIVAEGRHDELVAEGGLYARLAALQFSDAA